MLAAIRTYFSPESRLRRRLRRESYVRCEGDTATHWTGFDFDICGLYECQQPNGGMCLASMQQQAAYERKCAAAGIAP